MPDTKKQRIGGLWLKKLSSGKRLLEGRLKQSEILDALREIAPGGEDVQVTVWLNREEDKRNANSPDASLVLSQKFQKSEKFQKKDSVEDDSLKVEDIPF
jgi:hypothetical protein